MHVTFLFSHHFAAIPHTGSDRLKYALPTHSTGSVSALHFLQNLPLAAKQTIVLLSVPPLPFDESNRVAG